MYNFTSQKNYCGVILNELYTKGWTPDERVDILLKKESFGVHALRSVGATLAGNKDMTDHLFKRQGISKSENRKGGYTEDRG